MSKILFLRSKLVKICEFSADLKAILVFYVEILIFHVKNSVFKVKIGQNL